MEWKCAFRVWLKLAAMLLVQMMMKMLKHSQEQLSLNGEQPPIIGGTKAQKSAKSTDTSVSVLVVLHHSLCFRLFPLFVSLVCLPLFTSLFVQILLSHID